MNRRILLCLFGLLLLATNAGAQGKGYTERAKKYIDDYSTLAILEQRRSGIPASITLGQGILETEAGASELMTEANNHFGIKCKNGWQGPTYAHTDDAPNECFKKYNCAAESFTDHSTLLKKNPRYAPLLSLPQTDYSAWAKCLKKCGYATNPQYAERLIKIIEDFKLQEYTYTGLDSELINVHSDVAAPVLLSGLTADKPFGGPDTGKNKKVVSTSVLGKIADSARNVMMHPMNVVAKAAAPVASVAPPIARLAVYPVPVKTQPQTAAVVKLATEEVSKPAAEESRIIIVNGLKAFYGYKDEMLLQYAMKYHVGYQQLLSINDLKDAPLPYNMYVYLERKLTRGTNVQHEVKDGENLFIAAQAEGMQLKSLMELNKLNPNEEPIPGSILELQTPARMKPAVSTGQTPAHTRNSIVMASENQPVRGGDYIEIPKTKAGTFADTARPRLATPAIKIAAPLPTDKVVPSVPILGRTMGTEIVNKPQASVAAPAPNAAIVKATKYYTVKKGDTAFSIAKNNNVSLTQLSEWNDLEGNQIKVGQNLQIKE
jgi:LysM repeat protein